MISPIRRAGVLLILACAAVWAAPAAVRAQSGAWTSLPGSPSAPTPRRECASVYDAAHQRYLVFAGATEPYQLFNEVWVLTLSGTPSWSHLTINGPIPGERHSPQWGYDAARNRVIVFGGYGSHLPGQPWEYLDDVWQLSLNGNPHWTELHPSGVAPSGRLAGAAVYDPMRQRFVGFGGTIGAPVDTWILDLRGQPSWEHMPISGARPNGGWGMASVYDARRDRMLIFGGSLDDNYYGSKNDVWELDLRDTPRWKQIAASGTLPKARRSCASIYDPIRNRMIIYGGFDALQYSDEFLGDAWALSLSDTPTWAALTPSGTAPVGRDGVSAAYDPLHDRMVFFGGWSGWQMLGDTQFLEWGEPGEDAVMDAAPVASATSAHLDWTVGAATGTHAAVYRRDPAGEWTSLGDAEVDAANHVVYDDVAVAPGNPYDYMMVVASQRGETFGGQVTVDIPSTTAVGPGTGSRFALGSIAPNPAVDRMQVSFTLATQEPARLDLLDVAGRLVLSREVASLGTGLHQVELALGRQAREGLYFVRLTQGTHSASSRIAITRTN